MKRILILALISAAAFACGDGGGILGGKDKYYIAAHNAGISGSGDGKLAGV